VVLVLPSGVVLVAQPQVLNGGALLLRLMEGLLMLDVVGRICQKQLAFASLVGAVPAASVVLALPLLVALELLFLEELDALLELHPELLVLLLELVGVPLPLLDTLAGLGLELVELKLQLREHRFPLLQLATQLFQLLVFLILPFVVRLRVNLLELRFEIINLSLVGLEFLRKLKRSFLFDISHFPLHNGFQGIFLLEHVLRFLIKQGFLLLFELSLVLQSHAFHFGVEVVVEGLGFLQKILQGLLFLGTFFVFVNAKHVLHSLEFGFILRSYGFPLQHFFGNFIKAMGNID